MKAVMKTGQWTVACSCHDMAHQQRTTTVASLNPWRVNGGISGRTFGDATLVSPVSLHQQGLSQEIVRWRGSLVARATDSLHHTIEIDFDTSTSPTQTRCRTSLVAGFLEYRDSRY